LRTLQGTSFDSGEEKRGALITHDRSSDGIYYKVLWGFSFMSFSWGRLQVRSIYRWIATRWKKSQENPPDGTTEPSPSGSTSVFTKNLRLAEILGEKEDRHDAKIGRAEALLVCSLHAAWWTRAMGTYSTVMPSAYYLLEQPWSWIC